MVRRLVLALVVILGLVRLFVLSAKLLAALLVRLTSLLYAVVVLAIMRSLVVW